MVRQMRRILVLFLVVTCIPLSTVYAKPPGPTRTPKPTKTHTPTPTPNPTPSPTPTPTPTSTPTPGPITLVPTWSVPQLPSNCSLGTDSNGSQTLICSPASVSGWPWTATLVVFAHGYVNPYFPAKQIPWDQYVYEDANGTTISAYDLVTSQGYYFASTSYRANGLVVQDAIQDLLLVRQKAINKIRSDYPLYFVINVVLAGVSEGGLITTLSIERYPGSYTGGLAMCGPIGDFQKQVNYWGNFRALYDVYYPDEIRGVYGGDAVTIPGQLIYDWYGVDGSLLKPNVAANVISPDHLTWTENLLQVASAPYGAAVPGVPDLPDPINFQTTITGLLDYNIFATMNGESVLGGNPFDNIGVTYSGSMIGNLNDIVQRYTADPIALENIGSYQTTGQLTKPLVVLHTTGDPIVPYWHTTLYQAKVPAGYTDFAVDEVQRYGHCNFTQDEILAAFFQLGSFVTNLNILQAQSDLSPAQLQEYLDFLSSKGRLP